MRRTAAVAALAVVAVGIPAYAGPIPSNPGPSPSKAYLGHARAARPAHFGPEAPRHPYMARNGASNIHDDAYQSDAYPGGGPLGRKPSVTSTFIVHECGSITFDRHGRIVTVCVGLDRPVLHVMNPRTLESLASYNLPPRDPATLPKVFSSFGGGGYFYLDNRDRVVVPTSTGHIVTIRARGSSLTKVRDYDLSDVVGNSTIVSALPDWSGRLWFVTTSGVIGYVGRVHHHVHAIATHEPIGNSFAVDETGAVWIATDYALYRFVVRNHKPHVAWKVRYDRGTRIKPGQTEHGTGTTPTIIRRHGHHYIAITDNADPRMHVVVYREGVRHPICKQPVFARNRGDTDNSLIALGRGIIVENNYGYTGPTERPPDGPFRSTPTTEPGMTRVDVDYRHGGCHVRWANKWVRIPSLVSKASARTGLVYVYEHPAASEIHYAGAPPGPGQDGDPWYLTALDLRTGKRVWSVLTGYGLGYNNNYAPVTIGPRGSGGKGKRAAYVGVLGGLVRIVDTS